MADREIVERIDRHMARGNELAAQMRDVVAENTRVVAENGRVIAENTRVIEDTRVFMRDLVARQDRALQRHERVFETVIKELGGLREEARAQRAALFRLLDRLPPPGDAPNSA